MRKRADILGGVSLSITLFVCVFFGSNAYPFEFVEVTKSHGLPSDWVTALCVDERGIWVGTKYGGVTLVSSPGAVQRTFGVGQGLPSANVTSLAAFGGKVYAGTDAGLGIYDGRSWTSVRNVAAVILENVFLGVDSAGSRLWVGAVNTAGGLLRFDGRNWEEIGGRGRGALNYFQSFAFQDGTAWLGSSSGGVYRRTDDLYRWYRGRDGLPSSSVHALAIFGGTVWAGTSSGAAQLEGERWKSVPAAGRFPISTVLAMAAAPQALYFGGSEGLVRYGAGTFEALAAGKDLPDRVQQINALLYSGGQLYAGTSGGLLIVKGW